MVGSRAAVPPGAGPGSGDGNWWAGRAGPPLVTRRPTSAPAADHTRSAVTATGSPSGPTPEADPLHQSRSAPSGFGCDTSTGATGGAPAPSAMRSYQAQMPLPGRGAPAWRAWYAKPSHMTNGSPSTFSTDRVDRTSPSLDVSAKTAPTRWDS